jgi:hypothetical protein
MAIQDIPEFVEFGPGDLIRAEDWNAVQQQMRESLRTHHHNRPLGTPPDDSGVSDDAEQINTDGIADGAITASKLAPNSVSQTNVAANSIGTDQLVDKSVITAKLGDAQVSGAKLKFSTVATSSTVLVAGQTFEQLVQSAAPSTKTTIYFPTLSLVFTSAGGFADVTAQIVYRQTGGASTIDVYIRLSNAGNAQTSVFWQVLTFA